jgi:secretion/DNA translocation related TadE-like protein
VSSFWSDDRGSGSVLAVSIVFAVLAVGAGAITVVGAAGAHARAAAAADLAAIAAADVVAGRTAGVPCDVAETVARANGAALTGCAQSGAIITVIASTPYLSLGASASARAGPREGG